MLTPMQINMYKHQLSDRNPEALMESIQSDVIIEFDVVSLNESTTISMVRVDVDGNRTVTDSIKVQPLQG